jgi:hypothetical protein
MAEGAVSWSIHRVSPFAVAHQINDSLVISDLCVSDSQMLVKFMLRVEGLVASFNTFPPFAMCL